MFTNMKWRDDLDYYGALIRYALTSPRVKRDRSFVSDAYDSHWNTYSEHLAKAASISDWLHIPEMDAQRGHYNRDGKLVFESFDSVSFYRDTIRSALLNSFPEARSVTEYGCGVGRNVLDLQERLPAFQCYGYELSEKGAAIGSAAAAKFGSRAQYAQLDYLRDSDERFVFPVADVAFTSFSLEQLPKDVHVALDRILRRTRYGAIHLEPVPENYPLNIRALLGRVYSWKEGYLHGFDESVRKLSGYTVTKQVLSSSHNAVMFPSLYIIKKAEPAPKRR